jgi:HEAT repeat protein
MQRGKVLAKLVVASLLLVPCSMIIAQRHANANPEFLMSHGYAATAEGMVAALKDNDPEVRDRAAAELAFEKVTAAATAIKDAVSAEKDPDVQVNLAYALALLGDKGGILDLQHFCESDPTRPRLKATLYLLRDFADESCFGAVAAVLKSDSESDHPFVAQAMSLIPWFRDLPPSKQSQLIALTAKRLSDYDPNTRIVASQTLAKVADSEVIPALQKAIADEPDDVARGAMQRELDQLKAKANR